MSTRPMRFRRAVREAPEISLIAFIDVLLVILIFLVLSSSYNSLTQVQVKLPVADTQAAPTVAQRINLVVSADGRYAIGNEALAAATVRGLAERLRNAKLAAESEAVSAPSRASVPSAQATPTREDTLLVISADASASHQAVILAMTAANRAGLQQITFMSQRSAAGKPRPGPLP